MSRSLKFLIFASVLYLVISIWTSTHLDVVQNMAWVYPALVATIVANIVLLVFRYLQVVKRWIGVALALFLFWDLCVTLILTGTTGINPKLSFDTWRPVIVFSRQMLVLSGIWLAYTLWFETFGLRQNLWNVVDSDFD